MAAARLIALLACLLGLGGIVSAAVDLQSLQLPSCALACIFTEISHSDCAITNQTCMCTDTAYMGYVETCVMANCTVKEGLVTKNQTQTACGVPVVEYDNVMQWLRGILFALPTFFILVRAVNKYLKLSPWGWDDTTIMIAYVVLAAFMPANYLITKAGSGRDIWTLTPGQITDLLLIVYIFGLCYITCLAAIKASILFLCLRIFPEGKFRKALWLTQLFNLLLWISFIASTIASCQPIEYFWIGWTKETEGRCFDLNAFAICHGAFNVALDVWMLALPASQIYNLNMQPKQKLGVMLMFGVGIFLTAVSAYRIRALTSFAVSYNATANTYQTSIWSHIELCVGIFVACLPSTRQLWHMVFPKIVKVTHASLRSTKSAKVSHIASQVPSSVPGGGGAQPRVISDEQSSISQLMRESNDIHLNDLSDAGSVHADLAKATKSPAVVKIVPRSDSPNGS